MFVATFTSPRYSDEQLSLMEEQEATTAAAAATAGAEDLPVEDEEPGIAGAGAEWWCPCSHCAPMDTESPSAAENLKDANFFRTKSLNQKRTRTYMLWSVLVLHRIWTAESWRLISESQRNCHLHYLHIYFC